jgi:hypothetical protein
MKNNERKKERGVNKTEKSRRKKGRRNKGLRRWSLNRREELNKQKRHW